MKKALSNIAYIDSQNLNLGIRSLGWNLSYKKFRIYLREKYGVDTAYMFIGFVQHNQNLYTSLQKAGFVLKFKPTVLDNKDKVKGNTDADMVLQIVRDFYEKQFDKAILITSDGDFYSVVDFLHEKQALGLVLSAYKSTCSTLLRKSAREKIVFIDNLRGKLEYIKKNTA